MKTKTHRKISIHTLMFLTLLLCGVVPGLCSQSRRLSARLGLS